MSELESERSQRELRRVTSFPPLSSYPNLPGFVCGAAVGRVAITVTDYAEG